MGPGCVTVGSDRSALAVPAALPTPKWEIRCRLLFLPGLYIPLAVASFISKSPSYELLVCFCKYVCAINIFVCLRNFYIIVHCILHANRLQEKKKLFEINFQKQLLTQI